ncbi:hypothetical protein BIW11_03187 [Tropilaelaps mercedesae]|uniref:Uncharacterized protein n=1 Tax=Tropilaelaps mercedesae TaxID=418985 RepID=A0A1V9XQS7_9ACAR|nr:hypothetical protein BIW11_03187 [Tropilaelaps mercedesae]
MRKKHENWGCTQATWMTVRCASNRLNRLKAWVSSGTQPNSQPKQNSPHHTPSRSGSGFYQGLTRDISQGARPALFQRNRHRRGLKPRATNRYETAKSSSPLHGGQFALTASSIVATQFRVGLELIAFSPIPC